VFAGSRLAAERRRNYPLSIEASDTSPTPTDADARSARFALVVTLWGIFGSNLTLTILTIALPHIARDLSAPRALTNWVTLGPMLVVSVLTPAAGRLADNYGRKRIWVIGSVLALLGMLGSAFAPSIHALILVRLATGVGTALMVPAGLAIATSLYPPDKRATPVGYWTSTVAISPMVGVLVGGALLDVMSWRWLFAAQILLGLPPLIAAVVGFAEQRYPTSGRFDWEGAIAIGTTSLSLMLATTWLARDGVTSPSVLSALAASIAAGVWARSAERRATNPVLPPWLLREPAVALSLLCRLTANFAYMGSFMILPYMLGELWQLSASAVSLRLVWRPLAMGLTGPFAGRLALRYGPGRLVVVGTAAILVSTAAFVFLDEVPSSALLVTGLWVAGIGLGLSSPGSVAIVTSRVDASVLGTVSGLMTLTATLANALGMAIMFAVVEMAGGVGSIFAYRASFVVGTLVLVVGLGSALRLTQLEDRARVGEPLRDAM
jgi:MFS family permease